MRLHYRLILFSILFIWCVGIFSQILIHINGNIVYLYPFLKKSYSIVCHQEKTKLITAGGFETFVCARCAGIYIGLLTSATLSIFFKTFKKIELKFFLLVSLPMVLDVTFVSFGLYDYSKYIAFITGLLFGSVGFSYFYNSLNDLLIELRTRK